MKIVHLGAEHSIINNYMAQLRDVQVQANRPLFRRNLERIARAMAYEVSRTLHYEEQCVTTPLGTKQVPVCTDHLVIGTVLRAGLAFHQGFLDTFDHADAGFVAAYREEKPGQPLQIHLDYLAAPRIEGSTFLLVDPMLATNITPTMPRHPLVWHRGSPFLRSTCTSPSCQVPWPLSMPCARPV